MKGYRNKNFWMIFISLALCACSARNGIHSTQPEDTLKHIQRTLTESSVKDQSSDNTAEKSAEIVPDAIKQALMPDYKYQLPAGVVVGLDQERFDITVNRMPARAFFMGLVKDTSINIVVHPDVDGRITLALKNVTIDEVLEITRDIYGYEYEKTRTGYLVMASRLQSRIFHVNYLNVLRQGESNTRVTSGSVSDIDGNRGRGAANVNKSADNDAGESKQTRAFSSSRIATRSEADFWEGLEKTVTTIVGDEKGRSVVVSPQAGLVVVRAMQPELRDVEKFLDRAQLNMHRQVILEAKIIEVSLNEHYQAGVNWALLSQSNTESTIGGQLQIFDGASEFIGADGRALRNGLFSTDLLPGFGSLFAVGAANGDFAAIIRLLNQQGDVNVLSSPRVSTVNNQKAVIKVGSDEFFVTEVSSTTTTGAATTTTPQITLTPFFSGIALDVTPQIDQSNEVILHIHPTISEVKDQTKDITVAGQTQSLPLAFSTVRESDSIVRARNGQVIVIGGLMQDRTSDNNSGVPVLRDIPLLGRLFRQKQKQSTRSELVILLKPIVVGEDQGVWHEQVGRVSNRIDKLQK